jgi:hypothetical protein
MTEPGNSGDALSGVVMGKMAASALAGEGEAESVTSIAAKIDGVPSSPACSSPKA